MSTAQAYPLHWPSHVPRTTRREKSKFKTSLSAALNNVRKSLALFGSDSRKAVTNLVLSSNVSLGNESPTDPGVAVWFTWDGLSVCIPVDRYLRPEANLQAIHHIIEARRTELRHGTLTLVRATFQGFTALPPPPGAKVKRPWWEVMDLDPQRNTPAQIEARYRELAEERRKVALAQRTAKAQVTRLKTRAKAGLCLCCNRHFTNLERHMASKHQGEVLQ